MLAGSGVAVSRREHKLSAKGEKKIASRWREVKEHEAMVACGKN